MNSNWCLPSRTVDIERFDTAVRSECISESLRNEYLRLSGCELESRSPVRSKGSEGEENFVFPEVLVAGERGTFFTDGRGWRCGLLWGSGRGGKLGFATVWSLGRRGLFDCGVPLGGRDGLNFETTNEKSTWKIERGWRNASKYRVPHHYMQDNEKRKYEMEEIVRNRQIAKPTVPIFDVIFSNWLPSIVFFRLGSSKLGLSKGLNS